MTLDRGAAWSAVQLWVASVSRRKPSPAQSPSSNLNRQEDALAELQPSANTEQILPEQDRGYAAMSFLIAAAVTGAITWSIPISFGILIEHYLQLPEIASQPDAFKLIPLVGQMASGTIYSSAPFVYPYMTRYRSHVRPLMWLGMTLCWTSLLIASYSRKVYEYVIFQGVVYGIGGGLVYPPCILYMTEWFSKRRGLANGFIFAGSSIGGLVMPFILPSLVEAYGLFLTLRIISVAMFFLLFPCLLFIRPRLPVLRAHAGSNDTTKVSSLTLRNRTWWTLVAANMFQALAFFVPLIYIPVFTTALHFDSTLSSLALALPSVSFATGPVLVGFLSDHFTPWPIALILSILSLLCTVVFWGAIGDVVGVMLFGITYGFTAGGWSTLWSSFIRRISCDNTSLSMSMFGVLMFTRGLGGVLSTPISTALAPVQAHFTTDGGSGQGFVLDGGQFVPVIVYIVACYTAAMFASAIGWYLGD